MQKSRTQRACYTCGLTDNLVIAEEQCEERFGRPFMPEGVYRFAKCGRCGTLYVDSDVSDEYLRDLYAMETVSSVLEIQPEYSREERMSLRLPEFLHHWEHLTAHRTPSQGERLLDMGCQTGEFGLVAMGDGLIPNGTELSAEYAETCRKLWGDSSIVHNGGLSDAPFRSGQFQYVTAFETLEHVCDPLAEMARLRSWMSADGLFAMSVPSSDYFHFKYWLLTGTPLSPLLRRIAAARTPFYRKQILPHSHIYSFTPEAVRRLLERAGFDVLEISLTGWHSRTPLPAVWFGNISTALTGGSRALAPSIFAVARIGQR